MCLKIVKPKSFATPTTKLCQWWIYSISLDAIRYATIQLPISWKVTKLYKQQTNLSYRNTAQSLPALAYWIMEVQRKGNQTGTKLISFSHSDPTCMIWILLNWCGPKLRSWSGTTVQWRARHFRHYNLLGIFSNEKRLEKLRLPCWEHTELVLGK